jgi:6-phosphofructokinase
MGEPRRIGVLTGGGDCPGLNAALRAVVLRSTDANWEVVGFQNAWNGVLDGESQVLTRDTVRDILPRGGTILGTTRGGPFDTEGGPQRVGEVIRELGLAGIVAIGGNGTLTVSGRLFSEYGVPVIGVPKTIDNDVWGTETSFGFNTAVQIATDAIDRLHTTSASHDRVMVIEVMGRDAGWIAAAAAIAGGACAALVPERETAFEDLVTRLQTHHGKARASSIVVVAEGAALIRRDGGLGRLAEELTEATGFAVRTVSLGYVQRGGTPTAYDRTLATRYGNAAADAVQRGCWGEYVTFDGVGMVMKPLCDVIGRTRRLDETAVAELFASLF